MTALATENPVPSNERLLEPLRIAAERARQEFAQIEPERLKTLDSAAATIRKQLNSGHTAQLTFICTHNSRRSHLAQLWAATAACYYGLTPIETFSGGTEVSACNIRTVRTLRRDGFSIVQTGGGTNPVYLAQYSETRPPVKLYSKVYQAEGNPTSRYMAFLCCDHADASCPIVQGADERVAIHYLDPKASDNTPAESATYDARSHQIAREMFYLMSAVERKQ